jgi:hypothetical protein
MVLWSILLRILALLKILSYKARNCCLFIHSFINGILFVVSLRAPCFAGRLLEFNSRKQRMPFAKLVKQRCFGLLDMAAVLCLFVYLIGRHRVAYNSRHSNN